MCDSKTIDVYFTIADWERAWISVPYVCRNVTNILHFTVTYFCLWNWTLVSRLLNPYVAVLTACRLPERLKNASFCLQFMGEVRLILNVVINRMVFVAYVQCVFWELRIDI
jgi:hypothetical protein